MAQEEQRERLRQLRVARNNPGTRAELGGRGVYAPGEMFGYAPPSAPRPRGFGRALAALVFLCLIAAVLIGGVVYVMHSFQSAAGGPKRTVQFVVRPGESIPSIASALQQDGLISSSWLFQLYYRVNGGSSNVQAGSHTLNTAMTMDQIATVLQQPPPVSTPAQPVIRRGNALVPGFQIHFLPGKRAEEIGQLLQENGVVSEAAFMHAVRYGKYNYWFLKSRPPGASVEGFLYPGAPITVTKHDNAHRIVNLMLEEFNQAFSPAMHLAAAHEHRSVFQIVTMASIVQRESVRPQDLPYIASVYWNRLSNVNQVAQHLDADPTVQYAMGYRPSEHTWWEKYPSKIDTSINSPYNTYLHAGLPPGPISNPDLASLFAALHPAHSNFLYFQVLSKDGGKTYHTYFCPTIACQQSQAGVRVN